MAYLPADESPAADAAPAPDAAPAGALPDGLPGGLPVGLRLVHTVHEPGPGRSGLVDALGWIESGRANVLLVRRLGTVAASLGELVRLIGWLAERGASLISEQPELNTARRDGRLAVGVLREIQRWAVEPEPPRRPRGRPGLQTASPELAQRISQLRERGLSLQAIARALNAEGIPTPRGGARWRPSSVQTALGYRRPHPPGPGSSPRPGDGPPGGRPRQAGGRPRQAGGRSPQAGGRPAGRPRPSDGQPGSSPRPSDGRAGTPQGRGLGRSGSPPAPNTGRGDRPKRRGPAPGSRGGP